MSSCVALSLLALMCAAAPATNNIPIKSKTALTKRQQLFRSPNYSGAALLSSPDGTPFNYAITQINVPSTTFVAAEGQPGTTQKAAAWVGFDGSTRGSGICQTGCTFYNDGYGDVSTSCWYEFYPSPPVFYDGFSPSIGDTIQLEITRTSDTTGHSTITNLSTGQVVEADFAGPDGASSPGGNANWIVENPAGNPNFVNFGTQYFEGCSTTTASGNQYGPGDGSYRLYMEWKDLGDGNGQTKWTSSSLPSASEVQVDWVSTYT